MMFGRSVSSTKFSGDDLKDSQIEAGSRGVAANIFPPTLNSRSLPHWICSVVPGKERQTSRSASTCMAGLYAPRGLRRIPRREILGEDALGTGRTAHSANLLCMLQSTCPQARVSHDGAPAAVQGQAFVRARLAQA